MKKVLKSLLFVFVVLVGVLALTGCGAKKTEKYDSNLIGEWVSEDFDEFIYTFNKDGSGNYQVGQTNMKFSWETEGNMISIHYINDDFPIESEYRIEDNKFIIKDTAGDDVVYLKK